MLELIVVLSFVIGKVADFWIALFLLLVNAVLSFVQEQHALAAVFALRHQLQVKARVLRGGLWQSIPARQLVRGDVIRVRSGDFVPADVQIIDGEAEIDQSALTGESCELGRSTDDTLYSGSIVRQGEATAFVIATGVRTYFGRTTQLVESAHPKLHIEEVITRIVKWLFLIVGVMVSITVVVFLVQGIRFIEILPLSLVLLMSAVPVALPVMFTVSMAVGSIELAQRGVLVTRLSAAEDVANTTVLCADKTGTLTTNRLSVTGVLPEAGFTDNDVVRHGALASNEANQDPVDLAFLDAARHGDLLRGDEKVLSFEPFSPRTRRTLALVEYGDHTLRVVKGALRTVAELARVQPTGLVRLKACAQDQAQRGFRVLAIARANGNQPLKLVGLAFLSDPVRADSHKLIADLRALGVTVKMLTGDALAVAREVARQLGLGGSRVCLAQTGVLPIQQSKGRSVNSMVWQRFFPRTNFLLSKVCRLTTTSSA